MSLSDIYNPKEDMPVRNTADLKELNERIVERPRPTPNVNSTVQKLKLNPCDGIRPDHGLLNHWKDPIAVGICTIIFPWNTTGWNGPTTSSNISARNNGPNEALEYVQAYVDALTVITRGTLEDHLAKLKGPQEDARYSSKKNHC
jgi:hypothetical protein